DRGSEDREPASYPVLGLALVRANRRWIGDLDGILTRDEPHAPATRDVPHRDAAAVRDARRQRICGVAVRLLHSFRHLGAIAEQELRCRVARDVHSGSDLHAELARRTGGDARAITSEELPDVRTEVRIVVVEGRSVAVPIGKSVDEA